MPFFTCVRTCRRQRGFTFGQFAIWMFGGSSLLGIFTALLLPSISRGTGQAAHRTMCKNNLKQLGLALHNYHDVHGSFPPAYTEDDCGRPLHSWRTLLLPYLEQSDAYARLDLARAWDDPVNAAVFEEMSPDVFVCPSSAIPWRETSYLAIVSPLNPIKGPVTSGWSETSEGGGGISLMIAEVGEDQAVPWMKPADLMPDELLQLVEVAREDVYVSGNHYGGFQACLSDGTVRFISYDIDTGTLGGLLRGDPDVGEY
ncbi:MAG: DUF1559 domain-containing protein [Planctomycetota bacterium]